MSDKLKVNDMASCDIVRNNKPKNQLNLRGEWAVDHYDKDGNLIGRYHFPNLITNEGKDKLLDVMFHADTQVTTWYFGLIDNAGFSAVAATDVYDQIGGTNGWAEFTTYTDPANGDSALTRPEWPEDAAASQQITNSTVVSFDITGAGTVKGIFVVGGATAQTKSDATAGSYLWSGALFTGGDRTVAPSDTLKVTYTVSG